MKTELKETLDDNSISIDLNVVESEKFYVEKINITGNSITNDSVIRSSLIIDEGDPFNEILFNKSLFFELVPPVYTFLCSKIQSNSPLVPLIISLTLSSRICIDCK